ncbi:MAG: DUF6273 domain-containing protein [bacterium]|nr:DUF6273 domain-containing protein [bacterium]
MYKTSWKDRIYPVIGAVMVAVLSFFVLYAGDNVGLSDNGDFRRVLLANNLEYEDESDYYYLFKQDYRMTVEGSNPVTKAFSVLRTNKDWDIYSSPHFFFIKLSKLLNLFANWNAGREETAYNIGWLAGIYIFLFACAAWGIFTFFAGMRLRLKTAVLVIFLLVFCDAGYLLYFNSFYGEPLQYVALMMLLSVGLMIYKNPTIPKVVYFYISLYFFAGSKLANVPFSIIISLMAAVIIILRKDKRFKRWVLGSAAVSVIMMIGLYASIPEWMQQDTTYQSVFFGIVKESDTVNEDLEELGVDAKYSVLANTNAYMDESEYPIDVHSDEFKRDFYDRVSKLDLVMFYFNHPGRLFGKLSTAIKNTAYIRPPNLGNMPDVKMTLTDKYSTWSKLRVMLRFMYSPLIIFSIFALLSLYIIFLDIFYIRNRRLEDPKRMYMMIGINVLIAGLWINLILPMVANGEADLQKHMFLFIHCNDIMLMTLIIGMFSMTRRQVLISVSAVGVLTAAFYVRLPMRTVTFGTFEGKPVAWNVIQTYEDGSRLLVSKNNITEMAFDDKNNRWETSDIRIWLNRDFLREFTDDEKEKIVPVENELLLSAEDKDMASGGSHTHFWNFTPEQVGNLAESAYHYYLEDRVFLPTLDILDDVRARGKSWILCPYAANSYMQRYINNDGFILHTDVTNKIGVRAVVKVKE